jgi:SAM-dependent methyltransferase
MGREHAPWTSAAARWAGLRLLSEWVGPDGQVIGTDIQDEMLAAARQFVTAEGLGNVTLVNDDLFASQLEPASFDLVHARALIFPLGRGPEQMAAHLRLVRPGGTIVLEEVDTASLHHLPRAPAFDRLKPLVIEAFRKAGGDPDAATTQLELFRSAGIEPDVRAEIQALPPGHPTLQEPLQYLTALDGLLRVADRPRRAGTAPPTGRARTPGPRPMGTRLHPRPVLGRAWSLASVDPDGTARNQLLTCASHTGLTCVKVMRAQLRTRPDARGSMKVAELATSVRDAITVSRVIAEPYETDGITIIAAATVAGGGGGGAGTTTAARKARAAPWGWPSGRPARTSSRTAGCGGARRSTSTGCSLPSAPSLSPTCSPVHASRSHAQRRPSTRLINLDVRGWSTA